MKQCTVLFVNPDRQQSAHPEAMRGMGFLVDEVTEWPEDDAMVRNYHVVIVRVRKMNGAPMLAARLRAKPHFGRRLLIALVNADTPLRRSARRRSERLRRRHERLLRQPASDDEDPARPADAAGAALRAAAVDVEAIGSVRRQIAGRGSRVRPVVLGQVAVRG